MFPPEDDEEVSPVELLLDEVGSLVGSWVSEVEELSDVETSVEVSGVVEVELSPCDD